MTVGEIGIALLLAYLCLAQYWTNRLLRAQTELQFQSLEAIRQKLEETHEHLQYQAIYEKLDEAREKP